MHTHLPDGKQVGFASGMGCLCPSAGHAPLPRLPSSARRVRPSCRRRPRSAPVRSGPASAQWSSQLSKLASHSPLLGGSPAISTGGADAPACAFLVQVVDVLVRLTWRHGIGVSERGAPGLFFVPQAPVQQWKGPPHRAVSARVDPTVLADGAGHMSAAGRLPEPTCRCAFPSG